MNAPEEIRLAAYVTDLKTQLAPLYAEGKYQEALTELASLRESVDAFFDSVMVMDKDDNIRRNRLTLLNELRNLFLGVADISLLQ